MPARESNLDKCQRKFRQGQMMQQQACKLEGIECWNTHRSQVCIHHLLSGHGEVVVLCNGGRFHGRLRVQAHVSDN